MESLGIYLDINLDTVVSNYINAKKTTLDFNFDLYQAFKQHGYNYTN